MFVILDRAPNALAVPVPDVHVTAARRRQHDRIDESHETRTTDVTPTSRASAEAQAGVAHATGDGDLQGNPTESRLDDGDAAETAVTAAAIEAGTEAKIRSANGAGTGTGTGAGRSAHPRDADQGHEADDETGRGFEIEAEIEAENAAENEAEIEAETELEIEVAGPTDGALENGADERVEVETGDLVVRLPGGEAAALTTKNNPAPAGVAANFNRNPTRRKPTQR